MRPEETEKNGQASGKTAVTVFCLIIMLITAASDALRGVFLPAMKSGFGLDAGGAGMIITVSYIGNLLFLMLGGYLSDRIPKKLFLGGLLVLWAAALTMYVLTENYALLLAGMIFSMGGSTLLSNTVNITTPLIYASPALFVNIFNFSQGVGITVSQNIGGRFADSLDGWRGANLIILSLAAVCLVLLAFIKLPDPENPKESALSSYRHIFGKPVSILLIVTAGGYFIAEHGLQNWLISYGSEYLGFSVQDAAGYVSLFFGGLTVGRLVFAPVVQKLGTARSMRIFSAAAAVLYCVGIFLGKSGLLIVGLSGVAFSILYPTMVLMIAGLYEPGYSGAATGAVLSAATLADIGFNALFGGLVDSVGYGISICIMPVCMVIFTVGTFAATAKNLIK